MRIANLAGRAVLVRPDGAVDVETASGGRFGPDPLAVVQRWDEVLAWEPSCTQAGAAHDEADLLAPVPNPGQVFAIGVNYRDHARESGTALPEDLVVFTKFTSCLAGPRATVTLPSQRVDWETELVVVIGRTTRSIDVEHGWDAVAGLCVGQDLSDRAVQLRGPVPQFSLGKSFPGFGPFGPAVVSTDELADRDALAVSAVLTGPTADEHGQDGRWAVQDGTTADMVFSVPRIVADLSAVVTLEPGDLVFTGTPAGVGAGRGVFLGPGDVLTSGIEGLGTLRNAFVAADTPDGSGASR